MLVENLGAGEDKPKDLHYIYICIYVCICISIYMYKYYRKIKNTFFSTNTSMPLRFLLQCIRIKYFAKRYTAIIKSKLNEIKV